MAEMEAETVVHSSVEAHTEAVTEEDSLNRRLNSSEETDADESIHSFNVHHNITVIEKPPSPTKPLIVCEGSDSGVEIAENSHHHHCGYRRALSSNSGVSQEFEALNGARSCDSSINSCCSNYEEAYNFLVRRNSTLLEDFTLGRGGDGTSENGSESSSITGSSSSRNSKRAPLHEPKRKVSVDVKKATPKDRSRSKPPITPKRTDITPTRLKSIERLQALKSGAGSKARKQTPTSLELKSKEQKPRSASSSKTRTPSVTPTDDGRWPSVNSKPAPLMSRSLRGAIELSKVKMDTKTIEKYATLPRRRKDKTMVEEAKKPSPDVTRLSINPKKLRETTPSKILINNKKKQKVKIYHETGVQTALTVTDVNKALAGLLITPMSPCDVEKCDKNEQVDMSCKDIEVLQAQNKALVDKYEELRQQFKVQGEVLVATKEQLAEERVEKEGLREELKVNSQRVLAILGENSPNDEENVSSDSLMVLETRFQNVSQVVIGQEEEISKLNEYCRSLQIELEKTQSRQNILVQQHLELEAESKELQEFMQAEKSTLSDALKDAESENVKLTETLRVKEREFGEKQEECKRMHQLNDQRWQENLSLQARMGALEAKSRELLVHQGSSVSGTAVALTALINRLEGLVDELVTSYNISDQELEDVIFHNEAYSNSSSSADATPEKSRKNSTDKSSSPKRGSSFVSAVINALKSAAAQSPFAYRDLSKDNICTDNSSPNELLDSETEPCLMMEHVLEDVVVPDGHSHNMISSCHSLMSSSQMSHSESCKDFSRSCMSASLTNDMSYSLCDIFPSMSLVDQVIDVDNLVTRLLKVIRIIQLENDDCMNELQEQKDRLSEQVDKQREHDKIVGRQLRDWEILGARLKTEVKELMHQLSRKNNEIDNIKTELNKQREEVEKLNQDVCELSTALSKAELEMKMKDEEVSEAIRNWEGLNETPPADVLGRLLAAQNEIPMLKEKLAEKERRLDEMTQEYLAGKQVLMESFEQAANEAKKQYEAIDNALEVLHNNQNVVQQCAQLAELQRQLENISFQTASAMPLVAPADCNANAALLQALANLQVAAPINTTA